MTLNGSETNWNVIVKYGNFTNLLHILGSIFKTVFLQIVVPPLPSKALKRQLPFRQDDGIYEESFIEERRSGLENFVNK